MKRNVLDYITAYPCSGVDISNHLKSTSRRLTLTQRISRFVINTLLTTMTKGGRIMMAMFFAQRVILGKTEFKDVPKALKKGVAEVLIDSGLPELVPIEYGGTAENV